MGDNKNYTRLCLKNLPIYLTKDQILSIFFQDLDNVGIFFPKNLNNNNNNNSHSTKTAFAQLNSKNEGILALKFINRLGYQNVEACYADNKICNNKNKEGISYESHAAKCAFCGTLNSEYMCNDCSTVYYATFYCCADHQQKDWERHKTECKPLPQLRRTKELFPSLNGQSAPINNDNEDGPIETETAIARGKYFIQLNDLCMKVGFKVLIASVINHRVIYIRPATSEYDRLMSSIKKYSANASNLSNKPSINDYVLAPINGEYYRARVQDLLLESDIDGNNVMLSLTDFGNEIKFRWQDLKKLSYKMRGLVTYTHKVILNGVNNEKQNQVAEDYLRKIWTNKEELEIIEIYGTQKNNQKVILKHIESNSILNDDIKILANAIETERNYYDINKVPRFSTRKTVKILVTDYSQLDKKNLLSCMPNEKFSDYFNMLEELLKYVNRMSNDRYLPNLNEICLVKHNEQWYRACCCISEKNDDHLKFILIDQMIDVLIPVANVRKIPHFFAQHFYTSLCYVEGVNQHNQERIKEKIQKDKFIFADVNYDNETSCPVLRNIIV